ncbi:hypothetical protein HO173_010634 [Letharia columbiana]|uniref:Rhodopsin domain-containing protein n=1 Tax=Letharia columbiana TaxID=112416 RepID=A0A8H6L0M6_9LECA|nr:uncharacterized protein HO173_010634 [Letharia columbiana]KAF6231134.1 hypothetical protein HO173_010634 [Letharia columbiana]
MMSPGDVGGLTPSKLLSIVWVVTAIAITLVVFRFAIRLFIVKKTTIDNVLVSDVLVLLALATLITMAGLYGQVIPIMFDLDLVIAGKPPLSPETMLEFEERADYYLRVQFGIIILFWTCVWAVKLSILVFYKSLFDRLSRAYLYAWWAVVVFVGLTYVGCWALQFDSCSPLKSYFKIGDCDKPRDIGVSNDSLYYSTAVDIACDLLIMALPLHLLIGLIGVNRKQKAGLAALFCLGFFIIAVALVRVFQTRTTKEHQADPIWLALWSQIEASVAVVVSCLPSFGWLLNKRASSESAYKRRNPSSSGRSTSGIRSPKYPAEAMRLGTIRQGTFLEIDSQDPRDSFDHVAAAEREGAPNTVISKSSRTESQEDVLPSVPHNRILLRQDMVRTEETL